MSVHAPANPDVEPVPGSDRIHLKVEGMVCAGCAASVQKALESRPGVASATVSVTDGRATVRGSGLDPDALAQAIEARGFHATPETEVLAPSELRTEIELRQQRSERSWRFRAIIGLSIWAPLEAMHWIGESMHWHGLWLPVLMLLGSTFVIVVVGSGFYRSAWNAAKKGTTNMDTLISIGATAAYVFSLVVFISMLLGRAIEQPLYFGEAAALLGIISLGHWMEARAAAKAGSAVRELLELQPDEAELIEAAQSQGIFVPGSSSIETRTIRSADVLPGDHILIRPGARIPVDGRVTDGESEIDESVVTGEPLPVRKSPGDSVVAGSMNTTGRLVIESTVDGRHTTVARIADLVRGAQTSKAEIQRLADYISSIFVPSVLGIGAATFLGWWLIAGNPAFGLIAMVTVLIISCPCALGLATPMAVMVGAGAASKRGILIKSAAALERASTLRHVVFDKTGTLTSGRPVVARIAPANGVDERELLQLAAAVESPSEHPIAIAIVNAAKERGIAIGNVSEFAAMPGEGVRGVVDGVPGYAGKSQVPPRVIEVRRVEGATCRVIADGVELGTIDVADEVRPDAKAAIERLRSLGYAVSMLSGDRRSVAESIGAAVGLVPKEIVAEATPEQKVDYIRSLRRREDHAGQGVIMVGDGINDAAALAEADLGIAIGSGTNVAIESADVVIPGEHVMAVPQTIALSHQTLRTIKQNLFLAFVYNSLAIPIAALGLLGMRGPLFAAAAMALSDISVVGNALRLRWRLARDASRRQRIKDPV